MDSFFLIPVKHLVIPSLPGGRFEIYDGIYLSDDLKRLREMMTAPLQEGMGKLDEEDFKNRGVYVYARKTWLTDDDSPETQLSTLESYLMIIHLWLTSLWMVKDCSVSVEEGFLEYPYKTPNARVTSSYFTGSVCSRGDGTHDHTTFSIDELKESSEHMTWYFPGKVEVHDLSPRLAQPYGDRERIARALFYVQSSRASNFVPFKITMYSSALESLTSTSTNEIAHQVAERVALILRSYYKNEGMEVYNSVKKGYEVRSKFIHGDVIKETKIGDYFRLSVQFDEYVRLVIKAAWANPELSDALLKSPAELNEYFLRKVFGKLDR